MSENRCPKCGAQWIEPKERGSWNGAFACGSYFHGQPPEFEPGNWCLRRQLAAAKAERDAAKAVVERLPKTADGVPIYPGMEIWSASCNCPVRSATVYVMWECGQLTCEQGRGQLTLSTKAEYVHSTREAALAAKPAEGASQGRD